MENVYLSTVTPVYQGAKYLDELVEELNKVRMSLESEDAPLRLIESIFVDDGSVDESSEVLSVLEQRFPWIKVLALSRNYGQHPATISGILHSSGDWIATLDEDMQHHPENIVDMLLYGVSKKSDVVYANPKGSVHQSYIRDKISKAYKRLIALLSGNPRVRYFNSFRIIRGSIARAAASVSGHDTYFDIAIGWFTDRILNIYLDLKDRRYNIEGKSGYSFSSLLEHARRMLTSSQVKVTRFGGLVGLFAIIASAILALYTIITRIIDPNTIQARGWASTMMVILFFSGLLSLLTVIILENLSIILLQSQGKPTFYIVDRTKDALLNCMLEKPQK